MPKGFTLTAEIVNRRRKEIFDACKKTFLEKGFRETSMREVAELAGMGKSSLYDYFHNKDEILLFIIEDMLAFITAKAQEISGMDLPADERLRRIMEVHMNFIVENKDTFFLISYEGRRLETESIQRVQKGRYAYQDMIRALVEEGIREGSFREVDPLLVARLVINTLMPVVFTTRPTGTPQQMLEEALDIILNGVQKE